MNFDKLAKGLSEVIGRTVARIFLVKYRTGHEQIYIVFSDGTHYELYDVESASGSRGVYPLGSAGIRESLRRGKTEEVIEIPPPA